MPTVLCHACAKATTLPDGWARPSYECPHCGVVVTLTLTAATPPVPVSVASGVVNTRATFHWGNVLLLVILGGSVIFTLMWLVMGAKNAGLVR